MGTVLFYIYTMLALGICWGSACVCGFAYASSGRRLYLAFTALFALYSIETAEVLFGEWVLASTDAVAASYYVVQMPWTRTIVAALAQACIQLAAMWFVDKEPGRSVVVWGAVFIGVSMGILWLVPAGPLQQWLYYTMRQVALAGTFIYLGYTYKTTGNKALQIRLSKYKRHYIALWALWACVVIEDILVILVLPMGTYPVWALVYFQDRNFSEGILALVAAFWVIKSAFHLLSIRLKEAPSTSSVDKLEDHVAEQMERAREACGLSERETEVLRLVVLGQTNREIATALYLAEGTVKKHVHNIMVKTETKSREALVLAFWKL